MRHICTEHCLPHRPNLDAVLELLSLLLPVLRVVDPQLHAHIEAADMQAHFALSWYITWFAYNLDQLQDAARLYDLFLASHPIMPIYAAAAILTVGCSPYHPALTTHHVQLYCE